MTSMIPKTPDDMLASADSIRASADDGYQRFRTRGDLSEEAKRSGIARTYLKAKTTMAGLKGSSENYQRTFLADAQKKAFGIDDLAGYDPVKRASVAMSYRDAMGRATQLQGPQEALELLKQANTIGDEPLARAIALHAWNNNVLGGYSDVLDAYAADRPAAGTALSQLANSHTRLNMRDALAYVVPPPSELNGMTDDQLQQLADKWPTA